LPKFRESSSLLSISSSPLFSLPFLSFLATPFLEALPAYFLPFFGCTFSSSSSSDSFFISFYLPLPFVSFFTAPEYSIFRPLSFFSFTFASFSASIYKA